MICDLDDYQVNLDNQVRVDDDQANVDVADNQVKVDDDQTVVDDNQVDVDADQAFVDDHRAVDQGGGQRLVRCQGCGAGFSSR